VERRLVATGGAWLSFEGERIGQGRENARKLLLENPDVRARLADAVYAAKGIKRPVLAKVEEPAASEARGEPEASEVH